MKEKVFKRIENLSYRIADLIFDFRLYMRYYQQQFDLSEYDLKSLSREISRIELGVQAIEKGNDYE